MNNRRILAPAAPGPQAVADLKVWLGLESSHDDAVIERQLLAALAACEAFIGGMPLAQSCEEILPVSGSLVPIYTRPVTGLLWVGVIAANGSRIALGPDEYVFELAADGGARLQVVSPGVETRVAVQFAAGMAADWTGLPASLRHGIERLAAHGYRTRAGEESDADHPPAAIAALWRPWRRMHLQ